MILDDLRRQRLHAMLDKLLDETNLDHGILFIREVELQGQRAHAISVTGVVGKESTIVRDLVEQIRSSR